MCQNDPTEFFNVSQVFGKQVCFLPAHYPLLPKGTDTGTKKEAQSDHLWSR